MIMDVLENNNVKLAINPRLSRIVHQDRIKKTYISPNHNNTRDHNKIGNNVEP